MDERNWKKEYKLFLVEVSLNRAMAAIMCHHAGNKKQVGFLHVAGLDSRLRSEKVFKFSDMEVELTPEMVRSLKDEMLEVVQPILVELREATK